MSMPVEHLPAWLIVPLSTVCFQLKCMLLRPCNPKEVASFVAPTPVINFFFNRTFYNNIIAIVTIYMYTPKIKSKKYLVIARATRD